MATQNKGLIKSYIADTVVGPYLICKNVTAAGHAALATAATDSLIGPTDELGAPKIGDNLDIVMGGIALVKLGGTVAGGDPITSNASGQGIKAATAGNVYIGFAFEGGVAGDIIGVRSAPGIL